MKKLQLGLAVISLGLASSTVFAAADGTVTINGKVVDQTDVCLKNRRLSLGRF